MMRQVLSAMAFLLIVASVASAEQATTGEVRSPSGKLLYKSRTHGDVTEVRTPSGKLVTKSKTTKDGKTEVRSPSGKLLYKTK